MLYIVLTSWKTFLLVTSDPNPKGKIPINIESEKTMPYVKGWYKKLRKMGNYSLFVTVKGDL